MRIRAQAIGWFCIASVCVGAAQLAQQLQIGGDFAFKFNGADYRISGAATFQESFNARPPIRLTFADLNNDGVALDVLLDIESLIGERIRIERQIPLYATIFADDGESAIICWSGSDNPNACVVVSDDGFDATVKIFEVVGSLQGRVRRVACAADPYHTLQREVHLEILKDGGDAANNLRVRAYLFCIEIPAAIITVDVSNIQWAGWGGGLPASLGNLNGDCVVDDADLLQVLFHFGSDESSSDANGDGIVDDADLLIMLFNFGTNV